jgi:hypothetical protein
MEFDVLEEKLKNIEEKIDNINAKVDKISLIVIGNGDIKDSVVYKLTEVQRIQSECPVQEIKRETRVAIIAFIVSALVFFAKSILSFFHINF